MSTSSTSPVKVESPTPSAGSPSGWRLRQRLARLILGLSAVLGIIAATAANATAAAAWTPWVYQVTITGTASGNPFSITGHLVLAPTVSTVGTTNGVNPYDACLGAGSPNASPTAGAIHYGTNSACFSGSGANVDTAYVAINASGYVTQPDSRFQATYYNSWTTRNSIAACPYSPVSGQTAYQLFTNNTVRGTVNLRGYGGAFCGYSTYSATVSGVRIQ